MFSRWTNVYGTVAAVFIFIGLILLALCLSLLLFTFGYGLITLILEGFFGFILPFSLWYSLGAWLITLVAGIFILPVGIAAKSSD